MSYQFSLKWNCTKTHALMGHRCRPTMNQPRRITAVRSKVTTLAMPLLHTTVVCLWFAQNKMNGFGGMISPEQGSRSSGNATRNKNRLTTIYPVQNVQRRLPHTSSGERAETRRKYCTPPNRKRREHSKRMADNKKKCVVNNSIRKMHEACRSYLNQFMWQVLECIFLGMENMWCGGRPERILYAVFAKLHCFNVRRILWVRVFCPRRHCIRITRFICMEHHRQPMVRVKPTHKYYIHSTESWKHFQNSQECEKLQSHELDDTQDTTQFNVPLQNELVCRFAIETACSHKMLRI